MYIAPSGDIWLLRDVPLDNTYQHTIYWPINSTGKQNQIDWFIGNNSSFVKRSFSNQTYTRLNRGVIRINALADDIYDCNYLVYRNTNFGTKLFFAFITSIEYVNNSVSEIHFEIDVIQTWYFDYNLRPCFIERTHARTDAIGDNIVPEPLEPGEYVHGISYTFGSTTLCVIMAIVETETASTGRIFGGIYSGTKLYAFNISDTAGISAKISSYIASPDSIVAIYLAPKSLISITTLPSGGTELQQSDVVTGVAESITIGTVPSSITFGGYTPHNNKLYTYPYTLLNVYNSQGKSANYRYEFFENGSASFEVGGNITLPVELVAIPIGYKSNNLTTKYVALNESVSISDYPVCSWNSDTYEAWAAQNAIPIAAQYIGTVGSLVTAGATPQVAIPTIIHKVVQTFTENYQKSIAADRLHGQTKGSASISMGTHRFYASALMVNRESAKCIDAFFDMFGYAIKKVQEPVRKNRRFFTYIKTVGCVISINTSLGGGIPADDANKICQLHDNGITYWDAAQTTLIGDYSLAATNSPIGT